MSQGGRIIKIIYAGSSPASAGGTGMFSIRKWFYGKIDNYIMKHHTDQFIHKTKIKDEIKNRIDNAVAYNNKLRDRQEKENLDAQKIQYEIQEYGYIAEIERLEKTVEDILIMKKKVMDLYYTTYSRAKELALITAENQHESNTIMNNVGDSMRRLDRIGEKANAAVKEIENKKEDEEEILRIKT